MVVEKLSRAVFEFKQQRVQYTVCKYEGLSGKLCAEVLRLISP